MPSTEYRDILYNAIDGLAMGAHAVRDNSAPLFFFIKFFHIPIQPGRFAVMSPELKLNTEFTGAFAFCFEFVLTYEIIG